MSADFFYGHINFQDLFMFHEHPRIITFLREPKSRVISQYFHHVKHFGSRKLNPNMIEKIMIDELFERSSSLKTFAANPHPFSQFQDYDNAMVRAVSGVGRRCRFNEIDESILNLAIKNLNKFWFIGVFEELDRSLNGFFQKLDKLKEYEVVKVKQYHEKKSGKEENLDSDTLATADALTKYDQLLYEYALKNLV